VDILGYGEEVVYVFNILAFESNLKEMNGGFVLSGAVIHPILCPHIISTST
jgi:hypothetical protein